MKRFFLCFIFILGCLFFSGCENRRVHDSEPAASVSSAQDLPFLRVLDAAVSYDSQTDDNLHLTGSVFSDVGIHSEVFHIAKPGRYLGSGDLFMICEDPPEMNQGSHYGVYQLQGHNLTSLQRSYFMDSLFLFGKSYQVAFEYVRYGDQILLTYVPAGQFSWYMADTDLGDGKCLLIFRCSLEGGDSLDYPVLLDLDTGDFQDFLREYPLSVLPTQLQSDPGNTVTYGISNAVLLEENRLLVRMNGGACYYFNTPSRLIHNISRLSERTIQGCSVSDRRIFCWDPDGLVWYVHRDTMEVTDMAILENVVFASGIWNGCGCSFALYETVEGQIWALDYLTEEAFLLPLPEGWNLDGERCHPSSDGRKLFQLQSHEDGCIQLLIFDCDLKKFLVMERENPNAVKESHVQWTEDNSIVITSASMQDFYVYKWMKQEETVVYTEQSQPISRNDTDFVLVSDYIPDLFTEMKYAYGDNFTGQAIYDFQDAYLRYGTVQKLMLVQEELRAMGLRLKLWDGFRPVSAQFKLWEICPDDTYVANPNVGFSSHSRGNTVDITLVDENGAELEMPTQFDDFSPLADRDYSDCTETAAANARLLESVMEKHGFKGYFGEWWHFADTVRYDVEKCFDPSVISLWQADCKEYITLRMEPDTGAEALAYIPSRETVTLLGYDGSFALVDFRGQRGYVLSAYLKQAGRE